jgi:hypothetical protein
MASFSPLRAANSLINLYDISGQRQAAGAAAAAQRRKDLLNEQLTQTRIGDISHRQGIADRAEKRAVSAYAYGVTQREAAEAAVKARTEASDAAKRLSDARAFNEAGARRDLLISQAAIAKVAADNAAAMADAQLREIESRTEQTEQATDNAFSADQRAAELQGSAVDAAEALATQRGAEAEATPARLKSEQTKLQGEIRKQILDAQLQKFNIDKNKSTEARTRQQDMVRDGALFRLTTPEGSADFGNLSPVQKRSWLEAHYIDASGYMPKPAASNAPAPPSPFALRARGIVKAKQDTVTGLENGGEFTPAAAVPRQPSGDAYFDEQRNWMDENAEAVTQVDEQFRRIYGKAPTQKQLTDEVAALTGNPYPTEKNSIDRLSDTLVRMHGEDKTTSRAAREKLNSGQVSVTNLETGESRVVDLQNGDARMTRAAEANKQIARLETAIHDIADSRQVLRDFEEGIGFFTSGFPGAISDAIAGGSDPNSLRFGPPLKQQLLLNTFKARAGFGALQDMRNNNLTGGALGNVSNQEVAFLQAVIGNLALGADGKYQKEELDRIHIRMQAMDYRLKMAALRDYQMGLMGDSPQVQKYMQSIEKTLIDQGFATRPDDGTLVVWSHKDIMDPEFRNKLAEADKYQGSVKGEFLRAEIGVGESQVIGGVTVKRLK